MGPDPEREITFVICGKIVHSGPFATADALRSIRYWFPDSRTVLSTWEGEDISGLSGLYDELCLSDPAPSRPKTPVYLHRLRKSFLNSLAAQQTLVHEALCRAATSWAVRLRTDCFLQGKQFLSFYQKWNQRLHACREEYRVFSDRVLVPWMYTRDPQKTSIAFELADGFQFGRTEDLLLLWNGAPPQPELLDHFTVHPDCGYANPMGLNQRFTTEQMFFLPVLQAGMERKGQDIRWPLWYCDPYFHTHFAQAENIYAANVLVGTFHQLGIASRWNAEEPWQKPGEFITLERLLEMAVRAGTLTEEEYAAFRGEAGQAIFGPKRWTRRLHMLARRIPGVQEAAGWYRRMAK